MLSLWNIYFLLPLSLPFSCHVVAFTRENFEEKQQPDTDTAGQLLSQPSHRPPGSGLAARSSVFGNENVDFLGLPMSLPLSSFEELDSQGVIGEYADLQETTEISLMYTNEKGTVISRPTDSAIEDATSKEMTQPQSTQEQLTLKYQSLETGTGSLLLFARTGEIQPTFPASQNETTNSSSPFLLSGSLPSDSSSPLFAGSRPTPEPPTPPVGDSWGWTIGPSVYTQEDTQEGSVPMKETGGGLIDITSNILHRGTVSIEEDKGKSPSLNKTERIHHLLNLTTITVNACQLLGKVWLPLNSINKTLKIPSLCMTAVFVLCILLADTVVLNSQNALHHFTPLSNLKNLSLTLPNPLSSVLLYKCFFYNRFSHSFLHQCINVGTFLFSVQSKSVSHIQRLLDNVVHTRTRSICCTHTHT